MSEGNEKLTFKIDNVNIKKLASTRFNSKYLVWSDISNDPLRDPPTARGDDGNLYYPLHAVAEIAKTDKTPKMVTFFEELKKGIYFGHKFDKSVIQDAGKIDGKDEYYIYSNPLKINNVLISNKLQINGNPTEPISTKGFRPLSQPLDPISLLPLNSAGEPDENIPFRGFCFPVGVYFQWKSGSYYQVPITKFTLTIIENKKKDKNDNYIYKLEDNNSKTIEKIIDNEDDYIIELKIFAKWKETDTYNVTDIMYEEITYSFYLSCWGNGGKGGNNKTVPIPIGTGWSGAGGGQGAYAKLCVALDKNITGKFMEIYINTNGAKIIFPSMADAWIMIGAGKDGASGVSGSSGGGAGGTISFSDNWNTETKEYIKILTTHNGVRGRNTIPNEDTISIYTNPFTPVIYNPEEIDMDINVGVRGESGYRGSQNRGGPGAGGYLGGWGGGVVEEGETLNYPTWFSGAGGGGANARGTFQHYGIYGAVGQIVMWY